MAGGGVVGPSQVVEVLAVAIGLPGSTELLIFITADHLALVGDGLNIVFVFVARLVQGMLQENRERRSVGKD